MIWKRLFGDSKIDEQAPITQEASIQPDDVDAQLEAAFDWLDETTAEMQGKGIGQFPRWDANIAERRLNFSDDTGNSLQFSCQVVGTFNREKGSWHWAWDHPSIPLESAGASLAVRDFGTKHGLGAFTTRQIEATDEDAWQFAALGGMLTNAVGVYRCQGSVEVFLTLYDSN